MDEIKLELSAYKDTIVTKDRLIVKLCNNVDSLEKNATQGCVQEIMDQTTELRVL